MADDDRRQSHDRPFLPSRAAGSRKGEVPPLGTRATGRLKLKPAVDSEERVDPPKNKRPAKSEGRETRQRTTGRKNLKPTGAPAEGKRVPRPTRGSDLPDQQAGRRPRGSAGQEGLGGYVRFTVHVEDGVM